MNAEKSNKSEDNNYQPNTAINENAYGPFQKDGVVNRVASGLGEVATIGGVSALTGVPAWMIAGIEASGEYTAEGWKRLGTDKNNINSLNNFDKGVAYGATNLWTKFNEICCSK